MRSTTASTALLSISTMNTRMTLAASRARSTPLSPSHRPSGNSTKPASSSWRKASSFFQAAASPADEHRSARCNRASPVPFSFC